MLADILNETRPWKTRFVVTRDPHASELGRSLGCEIIGEQEAGLNPALSLGTKYALAAGVERLLILPADVPAVSRRDVAALFGCREDVVVASSRDGGTTAMLRSPPDAIETAFGPDSARMHLEAAQTAGLKARHARPGSLQLDVDEYVDLQRLGAMSLDRQSIRLARGLSRR